MKKNLPLYTRAKSLPAILADRIVILDGSIPPLWTCPDRVFDLHTRYLAAGADVIRTHTFCANRIVQVDYGIEPSAYEMNVEFARLARAACDKYSTPEKPRFVAGSIGSTAQSSSLSHDLNDPYARRVTFEALRQAYYEQVKGLVEGGADVLLVETIFDTLNAKAALFAIDEFFEASGECLPIWISVSIPDMSGRMIGGQSVTAFWHSIRHARPLIVGLDDGLGKWMYPSIRELHHAAPDTFISCCPLAGTGGDERFHQTPDTICDFFSQIAREGLVNAVGGTAGSSMTPDYIQAIHRTVGSMPPRPLR